MHAGRAEVRESVDPYNRRVAWLLRVARALGLATLGVLAATALTPLPNVVARSLVTPDPATPVDAIVALAGAIHTDGTLSDDSIRRFLRATDLYTEGLAPLLVLSGGRPRPGLDEGDVRAALARRFGVPPSAIVTINANYTTRDEALAVAAALRPRGAHSVLVVTDWDHAGRARATFERVGFEVRVAVTRRPADAVSTPNGRLWLGWECVRELLALAYYRLLGLA
jgi:uncharacterized SAM-binding protein YcdF (DUF218 family)